MSDALDPRTLPLDGVTLMESSAGTGKTYTLCTLFLRLILEKRLAVDQILVVTFTDAAAEELRSRIRKRLVETATLLQSQTRPQTDDDFALWLWETHREAQPLILMAVRHFDLAQIFTIHGFCQRMLGKNGFESQMLLDTTLEPDLSPLRRQVCLDFWRQHILPLSGGIGRFVRARISPETLERLAALPALAQNPRLEPSTAAPVPTKLHEHFEAQCALVRELWGAQQDEIRDQLFDNPNLKANMAGSGLLEKRLASLDAFLRQPQANLGEDVLKLGQTHIQSMTKKNADPPNHPIFSLLDDLAATATTLGQALEAFCAGLRHRFLLSLNAELAVRKQERGVQDFDDLICAMRRAVDKESFVQVAREQYQAALIDEFQDTDELQYAIFDRLFGSGRSLFLIGDPKQAIYSFRGANLHTYLRAAKQCDRSATLTTNYRSTTELIAAVNRIFGLATNPFLNPDMPFHPVAGTKNPPHLTENGQITPALTIWQPRSATDKPISKGEAQGRIQEAVTAEIGRLLRGGASGAICIGTRPLQAADIAILVATNNQGQALRQSLCAQNIHSVLLRANTVFESPEALDILTLLRGLTEYQRPQSLRTALVSPICGLSVRDLESLDEEALETWLLRLAGWHGLWRREGVMTAMSRLFAELDVRARIVALPEGERRMTNLLHCLEILHAHERESHVSMRSLCVWFARQIVANRREEFQMRLESDRDAVHIVTIHKSKGLEYPIVFCPFLGRKPKANSEAALVHENGLLLDLGSEHFRARQKMAMNEERAEHIRLIYVALTRAACRCYTVWGRLNTADQSGAAWLFHGHRVLAVQDVSWKEISAADVCADLARLAGPELEVCDLPDVTPAPVPHALETSHLAPRLRTRVLGPPFRLSSFSGLTRNLAHAAVPGFDDDDKSGQAAEIMDMGRFPRGALAGSCLHRILELVRFSKPQSIAPAVTEGLRQFGLDAAWTGVVQDMVWRVLQADLGGFCLAQIDQRLVELEFLFPLRPISHQDLAAFYQQENIPDFSQRLDEVRFEPQQGFLTGFMDLVFCHQERFYLLDWKSNWLGPTPSHYTPEAMRQSVAENHYFLQYHLYCLALNRFLARRLPEYAFERHFGGVVYVYLRGLEATRPQNGLFFDRPEAAFLRNLDRLLIAQEEA